MNLQQGPWDHLQRPLGGGLVLRRSTNVGVTVYTFGERGPPLDCSIKHRMPNLPMLTKSCLTVVSGGRKNSASGISSNPTTETSLGTRIPFSSNARIAPRAI